MEEMTKQPVVESPPQKKRKSGLLGRLAKIILVLVFIWWFNNFTIKINKCKITSDKVETKVRIAVISDLHASKMSVNNSSVLKKIKKADPDFVCVLGDMHSNGANEEEKTQSLELMTDIEDSGYEVYFVLGEHDDRTTKYVDKMEAQGIDVLDYETADIEVGDTKVRLYGISNAYFSPTFDLSHEFGTPESEFYNILLAHIPNCSAYEKFGADLTICGDTHGGVIQIPFCGPAYYDGEVLPELTGDSENIYDKGLFSYDGGYMFITSGLGNYPIPLRFNNRPEVALLEIGAE